jgi:hypothetical protein
MRRRCIGLPQRHNVAAVLELPTEKSGVHDGSENFVELESAPEKFVV